MVRIRCPFCAASQDVDDSLQGQARPCCACDRVLLIPATSTPLPPPASTEAPRDRIIIEQKRGRRRPGGRRERRAGPSRGPWRYYTGAISAFGWVLVGLTALWLGGVGLALVSPRSSRLLLVVGSGLLVAGNVWIGFVAYRDSQVFGMLCFSTCLFAYVYVFMNPGETWRPAALTGLGFLFAITGLAVSPAPGAS